MWLADHLSLQAIVHNSWQWTRRSATGQKPIEDKIRLLEMEFPIKTSGLLPLAARDVILMQCMQCSRKL